MTIPDCSLTPTVDTWRLVAVGCHEDMADMIYIIIDTFLDWLVPGASFDYNVGGGGVHFTCDVHPTIPGRLYCSGEYPVVDSALQVCLQRAGDADPTCATFDEFMLLVPATCEGEEEPPPEEEEEPEPQTCFCAQFTDPGSCGTAGCAWDKDTDSCGPCP